VALILDTGPLYASLDRSDDDHDRCRSLIELADEPLVIPAPVLVELDSSNGWTSRSSRRSTTGTSGRCARATSTRFACFPIRRGRPSRRARPAPRR